MQLLLAEKPYNLICASDDKRLNTMAVARNADRGQTMTAKREALRERISKKTERICDIVDSIDQLACYLKVNVDDEYTALTIASLFDSFAYQISKLGLAIDLNTKNKLSTEAISFRAAMRMDVIFNFPDTDSLKDAISHDGIDLLQKTKSVSAEIMQLIDDVYEYATKYATDSVKSREIMYEMYKDLKALAIVISRCADDIRMDGLDDDTFL